MDYLDYLDRAAFRKRKVALAADILKAVAADIRKAVAAYDASTKRNSKSMADRWPVYGVEWYTPEVRAAVEVFETASGEKARFLTNAIGRPIHTDDDACVIAGIEAVLDAEIRKRKSPVPVTACPMPPFLCNCDWCIARSGDCNCIKCEEIKNADKSPVDLCKCNQCRATRKHTYSAEVPPATAEELKDSHLHSAPYGIPPKGWVPINECKCAWCSPWTYESSCTCNRCEYHRRSNPQ